MSFTIVCYSLFDITPSGVTGRRAPDVGQNVDNWLRQRNTQCNFDTVLQTISLRSQPEISVYPAKTMIKFDDERFGFLFDREEGEFPCWVFEFEIMHASVFNDGRDELGLLYTDCDTVPMLKCGTEWDKLPEFLDTSDELRNIYFEVKNEEK